MRTHHIIPPVRHGEASQLTRHAWITHSIQTPSCLARVGVHSIGKGAALTVDMTTSREMYRGWETYQEALIQAISPLTSEQLNYRTAGGLRSISETCLHIIGARGRWLHFGLGIGDETLDALGHWDDHDMPSRTSAELVEGLRLSWTPLWDTLSGWSVADLAHTVPNTDPDPGEPAEFTRQWIIWHLIEHDLHHGGEISLILGSNGLHGLGI